MAPSTLALWLKEQSVPLAIIVLMVLVVVLILRVSAARRRETMLRERGGISEATFTAYLQRYGFDPLIASTTYHYLQEEQLVAFPILPGDALDEDLGLDSEDIQQTVRDLTHRLKRDRNPGLRSAPMVTVEDLVRLLQASPRKAQTHSAAA